MHQKISFLKQKIDAIINYGTIVEAKASSGKALARVKVFDRVSDFLPVVSIANSFVKVWIPPLVGEQVAVISPYGDPSGGFIVASIFNKNQKEPSGANANNIVVEAGNTRFESDGEVVKLKAPTKIVFDTPLTKMSGDLEVAGKITDVKGDLTDHEHDVKDHSKAVPR